MDKWVVRNSDKYVAETVRVISGLTGIDEDADSIDEGNKQDLE
jgi:hypothetical protein